MWPRTLPFPNEFSRLRSVILGVGEAVVHEPLRVKIREPEKIKCVGCGQVHGFMYHHTSENHRVSTGTSVEVKSRCYEKNLCLRRFTHPMLLISDDDVGENVVSVLDPMFFLLSVAPLLPALRQWHLLRPRCVVKSDR